MIKEIINGHYLKLSKIRERENLLVAYSHKKYDYTFRSGSRTGALNGESNKEKTTKACRPMRPLTTVEA